MNVRCVCLHEWSWLVYSQLSDHWKQGNETQSHRIVYNTFPSSFPQPQLCYTNLSPFISAPFLTHTHTIADIIFFGEALPDRFAKCAVEDMPKCDLLLIMGTSLLVHPFASLVDR